MRTFKLVRNVDPTGVSGTGVVAEGAVFSDGTAVLHWTTGKYHTTTPHESIDSVTEIHCHRGYSRLVWDDADSPTGETGPAHDLLMHGAYTPLVDLLQEYVESGVTPPRVMVQAVGEDRPRDDRPHSRACGIRPHEHGPDCSRDCPTCHGRLHEAVFQ